ncbi:MAG: glycerol-3-phosphate 1-O-acyltransferase PlsY [Fibrobacter sp.]|nr:glycerol-3-phosphate 1-O-acyltransferase PlsY [Fibrobacter sp.]
MLGSIPTAVWVSKLWKKTDIRQHGSKNAGLTNIVRVFGWGPAVPVMIVDLGKGMLAPFLAMTIAPEITWLPLAAGLLVILGHSLTLFAGFKGGKGVLTGMGVFLVLAPLAAILAFTAWAVVAKASGYVSLASIIACLVLGLLLSLGYAFPASIFAHIAPSLLIVGWAVSLFVIYKHRVNVVRLAKGTENRFGRGKR